MISSILSTKINSIRVISGMVLVLLLVLLLPLQETGTGWRTRFVLVWSGNSPETLGHAIFEEQ